MAAKNAAKPPPSEFKTEKIKDFILNEAKALEEEIRASFLVCQEPYLRGPASDRQEKTLELNQFFKKNYTDRIAEGEIPYRLLDSKKVLKTLRKYVAENFSVSFSDLEVLREYQSSDIPDDIKKILEDIINICL